MSLHLAGVERLLPAKDYVDIGLRNAGDRHRLASHCVSTSPAGVVPPQRRLETPQVNLWVRYSRVCNSLQSTRRLVVDNEPNPNITDPWG